jgi:hypothetical protein
MGYPRLFRRSSAQSGARKAAQAAATRPVRWVRMRVPWRLAPRGTARSVALWRALAVGLVGYIVLGDRLVPLASAAIGRGRVLADRTVERVVDRVVGHEDGVTYEAPVVQPPAVPPTSV